MRVQVGECEDRIRQWAEFDGGPDGIETVIAARGDPALKLARILVKAGHDPGQPYETARGDVVAMRYRSLGAAAGLTVEELTDGSKAPRLVKYRPPNIAPGGEERGKDASDEDG